MLLPTARTATETRTPAPCANPVSISLTPTATSHNTRDVIAAPCPLTSPQLPLTAPDFASPAPPPFLDALNVQKASAKNATTASSFTLAKALKTSKAACPAVLLTASLTTKPVIRKFTITFWIIILYLILKKTKFTNHFSLSQMHALLKQHCLLWKMQRQQGLLRQMPTWNL